MYIFMKNNDVLKYILCNVKIEENTLVFSTTICLYQNTADLTSFKTVYITRSSLADHRSCWATAGRVCPSPLTVTQSPPMDSSSSLPSPVPALPSITSRHVTLLSAPTGRRHSLHVSELNSWSLAYLTKCSDLGLILPILLRMTGFVLSVCPNSVPSSLSATLPGSPYRTMGI